MPNHESRACALAIVGGGCSGVLVAIQLLRQGFDGRILIIEPRERLGEGLAYSTPFPLHLLNVPAGKMSALPSDPEHFLQWLRAIHFPDASAHAFVPRKLYARYLRNTLRNTLHRALPDRLAHIRAEVTAVEPDASRARLILSDGSFVSAGRVVLAIGNPASSNLAQFDESKHQGFWHVSPWFGDALRVRFEGERILLIGTGLTAVDTALALLNQNQGCHVSMISRRGLLPTVHDSAARSWGVWEPQQHGSLRSLFRELRGNIDRAQEAGDCWRGVIDAFRPLSNELWRELPLADQKRFFRHLKGFWEPHRHRMAPLIARQVNEHRARGSLSVIAGRVQAVHSHNGQAEVHTKSRRGGEQIRRVDRIVSCSGIQENYADSSRPLVRSLTALGVASANDLGVGLRTTGDGALVGAESRVSSTFFTLGPPRRGDLLETTAVPEIRVQAEALARHLIQTA